MIPPMIIPKEKGVATWWPFDGGGVGFSCSCGWRGEWMCDTIPSKCYCGAIYMRDTEKNIDTELRATPMHIAMEAKKQDRQQFDDLPWYKRMLKKRP